MSKKILMLTAVLAAASMTLAACGSENSSIQTSAPATEETTVGSQSETTAETTVSVDILPEESEELEVTAREDSEEGEGLIEQVSDNPLRPAIDKILTDTEWPVMDEVVDEFIITEYFILDPHNANYKELIVMQCPISAAMSEIVLINADDVDSAKEDLEARRTKAIEQDAWYPNDHILAENSIVGTNGSYAYFIIGESAAEAEKVLNDYLS